MNPVIEQALAFAGSGSPVFPCNLHKTPACAGGFTAATRDPDTIRSMFAAGAPLIGVPTGEASGFDALDLDPRGGSEAWRAEHAGRLPATRTHTTQSGGSHLLFRHHPGMRCSASRIAPGIDVRADGGYIVWWPAAGLDVLHPDTIAEWPEWLITAAQNRPAAEHGRSAASLAAPSVAAVVSLLERLPNPADADRDLYVRVMLGARGVIQGLESIGQLGDDGAAAIGDAAVSWAERWEGGAAANEQEKWERDWSIRDAPLAGWQSLESVASKLIPGYRLERAAAEFNAELPPPSPTAPARRANSDLTEDGVARAFCDDNEGRIVFDHTAQKLFRWDDNRWQLDDKHRVFHDVRLFARGVRETVDSAKHDIGRRRFAGEVERLGTADPRMAVSQAVWDADPWLLGVPGDAICLRTGLTLPPDPKRYIRRSTSVAPAAPGTPYPIWSAFLRDATCGDAELAGFLQRLAGYCLTADVSEEVMAFLYGPGQNGKACSWGRWRRSWRITPPRFLWRYSPRAAGSTSSITGRKWLARGLSRRAKPSPARRGRKARLRS